ncbi:ExbD/TolR family protein [Celeribacter marinus]|uniref:ExbD/TolR family protein n=1 Tax=Celeribacter marinus TaxID=1397108 RepID=UPI003F6BA8F8
MRFAPPQPRDTSASLLPMINVVFLLLIFFLIAGEMVQPAPVDIDLPTARSEEDAQGLFTLYMDAQGVLSFGDHIGHTPSLAALEAAVSGYCAVEECAGAPAILSLHADRAVAAADLARLLPELGGIGIAQIDLAAEAAGGTP